MSEQDELSTIALVLAQASEELLLYTRTRHGRIDCVRKTICRKSPFQRKISSDANNSTANNSSKTFCSIIGNNAAKSALYENVVLPLTVDREIRMQIFKGIRGGCGNVLLFGGILNKQYKRKVRH
jgi:hypothetical protein